MKAILVSLLFLCSCSTYLFNEETAFEEFPSESDVAGWEKTDISEFYAPDIKARRAEYISINNGSHVICTVYYSSKAGSLVNLLSFQDSSCFINNSEMIVVSSSKHANILYSGRMIEIKSEEDVSAVEIFEKYYLSDKRKTALPEILNLFDFNHNVRYNEEPLILGGKLSVYEGVPAFEQGRHFFAADAMSRDSADVVSSFLLKRSDVLTESLNESRVFFIKKEKNYDVVSVKGRYIFGFYNIEKIEEGKFLIEKTGKFIDEKGK